MIISEKQGICKVTRNFFDKKISHKETSSVCIYLKFI